jgi:integrase
VLKAIEIVNAKPRSKPYKLFDDRGLYLIINPNNSRWWRLKYRFGGREKSLSLGTYPDTSLKLARAKRDEYRQLLASNIDPSARRHLERAAQADTFAGIAKEWLQLCAMPNSSSTKPNTIRQHEKRLEKFVYPYIGTMPMAAIAAQDMLSLLRRIESNGIYETAHRVRSLCGRIFRFAVVTGRASHDVTADLKDALAPVRSQRFAAITKPKEIGALLRAIDGYQGQPSVTFALRLAPLLFVRPGELRGAEWSEFDLDAAEWRIPAERMKMKRQHIVPLSRQAIALLTELNRHTGAGQLLFPSLRSGTRPISENTLNAALRRLGYSKDQMTTHGFRTMASTRLNEMGYAPDIIELQLAHSDTNKVRAAYNRAERLKDRRTMMQRWADYLESLQTDTSKKVIYLTPGNVSSI